MLLDSCSCFEKRGINGGSRAKAGKGERDRFGLRHRVKIYSHLDQRHEWVLNWIEKRGVVGYNTELLVGILYADHCRTRMGDWNQY